MTTRAHRIEGIDHVQLAMPEGAEAEARAEEFFTGLLGLPRVPKPPELAARGGCWFELDDAKVHLGVESDFRPARKAHPALVVSNLDALCETLEQAGYPTRRTEDVPGKPQWYVDDPFGNRIEFIPG
jgi:catechol 2,3-dioxygenase-like lactoylglutathione lyase family enzyme